VKAGILTKQGDTFKSWKTRLFLCEGHFLYYFVSEQDEAPRGVISLVGCVVKVEPEVGAAKKSNCFSLRAKRSYNAHSKKQFADRLYYFLADSYSDMSDWMSILVKCSNWYPE